MKIAIGCDKLGLEFKKEFIKKLESGCHFIYDMGVMDGEDLDYPVIGAKVAEAVAYGRADRGILICGTGIGMCITANKTRGVYAAVCHDLYSTQRSILSNNANVMCIGALVVGKATALELLDVWMSLTFKDGPSTPKINKIKEIESHLKPEQMADFK